MIAGSNEARIKNSSVQQLPFQNYGLFDRNRYSAMCNEFCSHKLKCVCHMLVSNKTDTKAINYFRTTQTVRTTGMPDPPAEINFNWPFAIKLNV
jgi:hypothetical protein